MQWDTAALVAIITGLVQMFKVVGVPTKWSPFVAVICGILAGVFYFHPGDITSGVIQGCIIGLASIGFYSGPKNIARTMRTSSANSK